MSTYNATVLGSSSAIPRPGRACSSYLLRSTDRALVLDLGTGAFANLLLHQGVETLDAVCISHLHGDHFLDLVPLRYALRYGANKRTTPLPIYVPPGGLTVLKHFAKTWNSESRNFFDGVLELHEYSPEQPLEIADFVVTFMPTQHYIPAYAMRVSLDGVSLVYSADTAPDARIVELARDADFFICETTLGPDGFEPGKRGHCSAKDAGTMAQAANVRQLALTHYGVEHGAEELLTMARSYFRGPVTVLDDNYTFPIRCELVADRTT